MNATDNSKYFNGNECPPQKATDDVLLKLQQYIFTYILHVIEYSYVRIVLHSFMMKITNLLRIMCARINYPNIL